MRPNSIIFLTRPNSIVYWIISSTFPHQILTSTQTMDNWIIVSHTKNPQFPSGSQILVSMQGENLDYQNHTSSEADNGKEEYIRSHATVGWYADGPWPGTVASFFPLFNLFTLQSFPYRVGLILTTKYPSQVSFIYISPTCNLNCLLNHHISELLFTSSMLCIINRPS